MTVAGHLTVDKIFYEGHLRCESIGGPPAYGGLAIAQLGHNALILTRFGRDIFKERPPEIFAAGLKIAKNSLSSKPTTRFEAHYSLGGRRLRLVHRCSNLTPKQVAEASFGSVVVSPICGEISVKLLKQIKSKSDFVFIDPQGFIRTFNTEGWCSLATPSGRNFVQLADAIKVDPHEARALTHTTDPARVTSLLLKRGPSYTIFTMEGRSVYMSTKRGVWRFKPLPLTAVDTTGAGDILSTVFTATLASEGDAIWALSVSLASISEILVSRSRWGLDKVRLWRPSLELAERVMSSVKRID